MTSLATLGQQAVLAVMTSGELTALVITLTVVGFICLFLEVFVVPGFGFAGIVGIGAIGIGSAIAWSAFGTVWGATLLSAGLIATVMLMFVFFKTKVGRRFELDSNLSGAVAVHDDIGWQPGTRGVAETMLRPAGFVTFGDQRVEVETDGEFIDDGVDVVVVRVQMGRVVVEAAGPEHSDNDTNSDNQQESPDSVAKE